MLKILFFKQNKHFLRRTLLFQKKSRQVFSVKIGCYYFKKQLKSMFANIDFFCVWIQNMQNFRQKRKGFKAETIKRLPPRSKYYFFSRSRASRIQKFFLSANHGGQQYFSVFHGPPTLKSILPALILKICSKVYRRTSMLKWDFNKVALQLNWNHTSASVFSCKFAAYFQSMLLQEHLWRAASGPCYCLVSISNKLKTCVLKMNPQV